MKTKILALLVITAACATSASRRYVEYADTYTAAVESLTQAVTNGDIKPEEARRVQGYLKVVRNRIDEYEIAVASGVERNKLDTVLAAIQDALAEAARQYQVAKAMGGA